MTGRRDSTRRVKRTVAAVAALCLLGVTGCLSARTAPGSVDVAVSRDGEITLGDEPVALQKLPRELRALGATRRTGIKISVPDDASPVLLRRITESLASAGYSRLIFTTPRKASAVVP